MSDPFELLERVVRIADHAIRREADVHVPAATLRELLDQVEAERRKPCESFDERIIDDEASMMVQALINAELHELDQRADHAARWRTLAQCFLPFLRTDLARAIAGRRILG